MSPKENDKIWTHSIVSSRTRRGIVIIEWGDKAGQFDPEDARAFAHTILREADNAETDAFLFNHLQEVGVAEHVVVGFVAEYRKHRARLEQLSGLRKTTDEIPPSEAR